MTSMCFTASQPSEPQGFIDLQEVVKSFHIADSSLQKIYGIIFQDASPRASA